jgi:hypothetical protein
LATVPAPAQTTEARVAWICGTLNPAEWSLGSMKMSSSPQAPSLQRSGALKIAYQSVWACPGRARVRSLFAMPSAVRSSIENAPVTGSGVAPSSVAPSSTSTLSVGAAPAACEAAIAVTAIRASRPALARFIRPLDCPRFVIIAASSSIPDYAM